MSKANKLHTVIYTILGITVFVLAVMCAKNFKRAKELDTAVNNSYNRAFFEMTDYVNSIDALLSKAQLAATPAQLAAVSNEIFMQSAAAKSSLGQLPQQEVGLENTAKFLSQVGDYTYVLSQNMINGDTITDEEYANLAKLNEYAAKLGKSLSETEQRINSGEEELTNASVLVSAFAAGGSVLDDMANVEKSFEGYPSLIYDGPFSEHIENMEAFMIKAAPAISQDEALRVAREFLGDRGKDLRYDGTMMNTAIEAYNFISDTDGSTIAISITKKGGYVLYFLENRDVSENNYDITAATDAAMRFLEQRGITGMTENYYETKDNIATLNFAYSQNGVKCYSDLIKLRVALDNGEIIGMESKGYLMNHRTRDVDNISMTADQAREHISSHLDVSAVSLAIIPKDSLREVLCYEFKGSYLGKNFIIYVNAQNGREENILLLIESETGILTI